MNATQAEKIQELKDIQLDLFETWLEYWNQFPDINTWHQ
ncbi:hypothetical protein SAMN05877753_102625 [Bacillus oleivorans]|uniref:Uncharacterized protein n=1 Tax=Bacillus oleivorans TaxID=1448271 RepID=A0A285CM59_9BACI|nr:hypothetical protein SAMN05877753_102625 [Bacillus oleivorans]